MLKTEKELNITMLKTEKELNIMHRIPHSKQNANNSSCVTAPTSVSIDTTQFINFNNCIVVSCSEIYSPQKRSFLCPKFIAANLSTLFQRAFCLTQI